MQLPTSLKVLSILEQTGLMQPPLTAHENDARRRQALGISNPPPVPDLDGPLATGLLGFDTPESLVNHPALQSLLSDRERFLDVHRITVTEFLNLHVLLLPGLRSVRADAAGIGADPAHSHPTLTTAEQLLLWLLHMDGASTSALMVVFSALARSTILRYADHVTWAVNLVLKDVMYWPDAEERALWRGSLDFDERIIGMMDGTHCRIDRPTYAAKGYYATQKKIYSHNFLVCINPIAVITFVDGPFLGGENDRLMWKQSRLFSDPASHFSPGECLLADGGFDGGAHLLCPVRVDTINDEKSVEQQLEWIQYNVELGDDRVLVEDTFAWLKAAAKVLGERYIRDKDKHGEAMHAACRWYNAVRLLRVGAMLKIDTPFCPQSCCASSSPFCSRSFSSLTASCRAAAETGGIGTPLCLRSASSTAMLSA